MKLTPWKLTSLKKILCERGSTLMSAVAMMAIVAAISIPVIQIMSNDSVDTTNQINKTKAFFNATAALEWAKYKIANGENPNINYMPLNLSGGNNDGFGVVANPDTGLITGTGKANGALSVQKIVTKYSKDCFTIQNNGIDIQFPNNGPGYLKNIPITKTCNDVAISIIDKIDVTFSNKSTLQTIDTLWIDNENHFDNRNGFTPYGVALDDHAVDLLDYTWVDVSSTGSNGTNFGVGDSEAPTAPNNLNFSNLSGNQVTLTWNPSTDNDRINEYILYRDGATEVGRTQGTTLNDNNQAPGSTHNYVVKATDPTGNISPASNQISVQFPQAGDTQAPTAPTNLTFANVSSTSVTLNWNASTDNDRINEYTVYRDNAAIGNTQNLSFNDMNQAPGSSHSYTVKAKDPAGNVSSASNQVNVSFPNSGGGGADNQAPSAPTNLNFGNVSSTFVKLTWNPSTDNVSVMAYDIFRDGVQVMNINATAWNDTNQTAGSTHQYIIKARDASGNVSSGSNQVTVNFPSGVGGAGDTQPPSAPTNLTFNNVTNNGVTLNWNAASDNNGILDYIVYYDDVDVAHTTGTSFTDNGRPSGTAHNYKIKARDTAWSTSGFSNQANVQFANNPQQGGGDSQAPSAPTNLNFNNLTSTGVTLNWNPSTDNVAVTQYSLLQAGNVMVPNMQGNTFNLVNQVPGTTQNYTVIAKDAAGNSSQPSNQITVNFPQAGDSQAPTAPGNLIFNNVTANGVNLSWGAANDNVGVASYVIYRDNVEIAQVGGLSFGDNGQSAGSSHNYVVKAKDAAGNLSPPTNQVTVQFASQPATNTHYLHIHYTYPAGMSPSQPATFNVVVYFKDGSTISGAINW